MRFRIPDVNQNSSTSLSTARILGWIAAAAMGAAIAYGMAAGGFVDGLRTVLGDPWGRVTMIDLGVGLLLVGGWIRLREGAIGRAAPWWVALFFTGNLAAGIYVVLAARKARSIGELLTGQPST
jgi:hypothetical protein